jgi:hypothetical protein
MEKLCDSALTWVPGFWLLRAAIALADPVELVFCWKWIRPRGKRKTSPAFRVVEKSVSAENKEALESKVDNYTTFVNVRHVVNEQSQCV